MPTLVINGVYRDVDVNDIKECIVHSCTECNMQYLHDGKFNIKGAIHRALMTRESGGDINGNYKSTRLDCMNCPVHLNTSDEEWKRILSDIDGVN